MQQAAAEKDGLFSSRRSSQTDSKHIKTDITRQETNYCVIIGLEKETDFSCCLPIDTYLRKRIEATGRDKISIDFKFPVKVKISRTKLV